MSQQIKSLTGLRGIAALMIVIHHFPIALAPTWGAALQAKTHLIDNSYLKFSWQATFNPVFSQAMKFSAFSMLLGVEVVIVLVVSVFLYILIENPSRLGLTQSYFARKFIYYSSA